MHCMEQDHDLYTGWVHRSYEIVALRENVDRPESYDSFSAKSCIFLAHKKKNRARFSPFLYTTCPKARYKKNRKTFTFFSRTITNLINIWHRSEQPWKSHNLNFSPIIYHIRDLHVWSRYKGKSNSILFNQTRGQGATSLTWVILANISHINTCIITFLYCGPKRFGTIICTSLNLHYVRKLSCKSELSWLSGSQREIFSITSTIFCIFIPFEEDLALYYFFLYKHM
jgi:hypothetical protein